MPIVTIVGTTSWGTTLGIMLAREGVIVRMLARTNEEADTLEIHRENKRFVTGVQFPESMIVTADAREACAVSDLVAFAVPSGTLRDNVRKVSGFLDPNSIIVSATKGLEVNSGKRMSEVLYEEIGDAVKYGICALSGPNLAHEIASAKPSSTVIASSDYEASAKAQKIMNSSMFRVYTNNDIAGVEYCGALKNVIALGAGIVNGLEMGDNAKAAFITRGLAEITRLGVAGGASAPTFAGLAGMGDLIATCSSKLSRNRFVGEQLAKGLNVHQIRNMMSNVAEGIDTTHAVLKRADEFSVDMPIAHVIHDILFDDLPVSDAVTRLMGRAPTSE